jgi:hypothetical protein
MPKFEIPDMPTMPELQLPDFGLQASAGATSSPGFKLPQIQVWMVGSSRWSGGWSVDVCVCVWVGWGGGGGRADLSTPCA